MADTKLETPKTFGGFEALADGLIGKPGNDRDDLDHSVVDPEVIKKDDEDIDVDKDVDKDIDKDEDIDEDADVDKDKDIDVNKDKDVDKDVNITNDEFKELEPELTQMLRDELGKELDWEFEEDEKFDTIADLVNYVKDVVDESSKPTYANDEVKRLNDFVADGGDLSKFFNKTTSEEIDFDSVDMENEADQKRVIREYLKTRGLKDDRIRKSLNRYEDAGVLGEEAEDALDLLKEYKTKTKEKLLEDQKNYASDVRNQQQKFYSDVESEIKDIKDIRGFKITKEDKKDLLNYIFKPTADNKTAYQKAYATDVVKNLIESAYFTKNGDALIKAAKAEASSDAYKQIREKLKTKKAKRNISSGSREGGGGSGSFGSLSKTLLEG